MKKMKLITMLIASMFVGLAASSVSGAVELEATIDVTVTQFLAGLVSPVVNVTTEGQRNQSVTLMVNLTDPINKTGRVEDELVINLNIDDQSGRDVIPYIIPRWIIGTIMLKRDPIEALKNYNFMEGGLLKRFIPLTKLIMVPVVQTFQDDSEPTNFTVPLSFYVNNESFVNGENLTLSITVMGIIPGDINGFFNFDGQLPFLDKKEITLIIDYEEIL